MKIVKTIILITLFYTLCGISSVHASTIEPGILRVPLSQGERTYKSVRYTNTENIDIEVSIKPYAYNPKTDEISEESKYIFIKADTDTIKVKAKGYFDIKYEIIPIQNSPEGTYFNILSITPQLKNQNVSINSSIAQLVILDLVKAQDQVKGIVTTQYTTNIEVINKGIPFITPLKLKYSITNNSNYVLTPQGRIDIFNEKNTYKPIYTYINQEKEEIYPGETLEEEVAIKAWYVTDLFLKRVAMGEVYNGVDNIPQYIETEINSFILEISIGLIVVFLATLLIKSVKQDIKKKD
ncbi:MAG TPA: hypothetical protein PKH06_01615 [Candidatus Dojkabacteria bacterium]|nr:hypothetical protein [Candidatus Dojkabacteria bacterium]